MWDGEKEGSTTPIINRECSNRERIFLLEIAALKVKEKLKSGDSSPDTKKIFFYFQMLCLTSQHHCDLPPPPVLGEVCLRSLIPQAPGECVKAGVSPDDGDGR